MKSGLIFVGAVLLLTGCLHPDYARLHFESAEPEFEEAKLEYMAIWAQDARRILRALERGTGLEFEEGPVRVIVYEGVSFSGYKERPMHMRASYPIDTKRGTLVHEMSHRLVADLFLKGEEDHPYIFLFLYDVWVDLWGQEFADGQVAVESRRKGIYDYEGAWQAALALGEEGRARAWQEFLARRDHERHRHPIIEPK